MKFRSLPKIKHCCFSIAARSLTYGRNGFGLSSDLYGSLRHIWNNRGIRIWKKNFRAVIPMNFESTCYAANRRCFSPATSSLAPLLASEAVWDPLIDRLLPGYMVLVCAYLLKLLFSSSMAGTHENEHFVTFPVYWITTGTGQKQLILQISCPADKLFITWFVYVALL